MLGSQAAQRPPSVSSWRSIYFLKPRRGAILLRGPGIPLQKRVEPAFTAAAVHLPSAAAPATDDGGIPELVSWVQQNNGHVDGATLANLAGRDGASGWGLKASQDVEEGHRLILLPPSNQLIFGPQDDRRLLALIDRVPEELVAAKLALQLVAQRVRGSESPLSPYIAHLPKGVPGIPLFFSKRAVELIDYPPVSQQVKKRCKWLFDFSQQALAELPGTSEDPFGGVHVDINALGWAFACVTSRAFRTRGPTQPGAMLPLIDMANHSFKPNAEVLPVSGGAIGLFAKRKVSAGEPLLLSYGKLSNDFLFMDYGFIVPDNPYDSVQLRFDIGLLQAGCLVSNVVDTSGAPLDLSPTPWRLAALSELGLAGPNANLELHLGGSDGASSTSTSSDPAGEGELVDGRLLAAARIMVARQEGEVAGRGAQRLCAVDKPLSRENELAALHIVAGVVAVALSNFSTTLDQDLELLSGKVPTAPPAEAVASQQQQQRNPDLEQLSSEDEVLAVRFRVEKKRILTRTLHRLAALTSAVAGNSGLRQTTGVATAKKGQKPAPATSKGFGGKK